MTELMQIVPNFFNEFATARDKQQKKLESRNATIVNNPPIADASTKMVWLETSVKY